MASRTLLARKTFRTGVQSLWRYADGKHTLTIKNRSYRSEVPIPEEKVELWKELLR